MVGAERAARARFHRACSIQRIYLSLRIRNLIGGCKGGGEAGVFGTFLMWRGREFESCGSAG